MTTTKATTKAEAVAALIHRLQQPKGDTTTEAERQQHLRLHRAEADAALTQWLAEYARRHNAASTEASNKE